MYMVIAFFKQLPETIDDEFLHMFVFHFPCTHS